MYINKVQYDACILDDDKIVKCKHILKIYDRSER